MAADSQTAFFNTFSWTGKFCISIKISLKFVLKGVIDNKSALPVQVMACRRIGDKPLPEPMLTKFTQYVRRGFIRYCSKFGFDLGDGHRCHVVNIPYAFMF